MEEAPPPERRLPALQERMHEFLPKISCNAKGLAIPGFGACLRLATALQLKKNSRGERTQADTLKELKGRTVKCIGLEKH